MVTSVQMFKALKDAFAEPEPEPGFEEGVPPAGEKLQTELHALKLRQLIVPRGRVARWHTFFPGESAKLYWPSALKS